MPSSSPFSFLLPKTNSKANGGFSSKQRQCNGRTEKELYQNLSSKFLVHDFFADESLYSSSSLQSTVPLTFQNRELSKICADSQNDLYTLHQNDPSSRFGESQTYKTLNFDCRFILDKKE
jgi:hypothetical protein